MPPQHCCPLRASVCGSPAAGSSIEAGGYSIIKITPGLLAGAAQTCWEGSKVGNRDGGTVVTEPSPLNGGTRVGRTEVGGDGEQRAGPAGGTEGEAEQAGKERGNPGWRGGRKAAMAAAKALSCSPARRAAACPHAQPQPPGSSEEVSSSLSHPPALRRAIWRKFCPLPPANPPIQQHAGPRGLASSLRRDPVLRGRPRPTGLPPTLLARPPRPGGRRERAEDMTLSLPCLQHCSSPHSTAPHGAAAPPSSRLLSPVPSLPAARWQPHAVP